MGFGDKMKAFGLGALMAAGGAGAADAAPKPDHGSLTEKELSVAEVTDRIETVEKKTDDVIEVLEAVLKKKIPKDAEGHFCDLKDVVELAPALVTKFSDKEQGGWDDGAKRQAEALSRSAATIVQFTEQTLTLIEGRFDGNAAAALKSLRNVQQPELRHRAERAAEKLELIIKAKERLTRFQRMIPQMLPERSS